MKASQPSALGRGLSVIGKLFVGTRKGPSGDRVRQLKKLERKIGIKFTDLGLLEQALTHRSYSHVTSQTRNQSNERMEFLGDSVLGLSVSQFLYLQFPDRSEGALSKMKSLLVSRKVLSAVSRDAGLGEFLLLSGEESEMGGRDRSSILADSFEGVIGAIYLDQGFRAANKFIQRFLLGAIHEILKDEEHTNFKSLLQEYVQSKRLSHPVYRVRREEGPEHEKEFAIEVVVRSEVWGVGRGKSKKDAEQNAARAALESRQSRDASSRRSRTASPGEADTVTAERPARGPRDRDRPPGRGERRGRERREPREAREPKEAKEPRNVAPQDRGDHGILASREKLRSLRKEEAEQRRREEREFRERRDERARAEGRTEDRPREERVRPEEGSRGEGRRREGRRGRGGRPDRGVPSPIEAAAAGSAAPAPTERDEEVLAYGAVETVGAPETPVDRGAAPPAAAPDEEAASRGFGRRRRSRRGREGRPDGGWPRKEEAAAPAPPIAAEPVAELPVAEEPEPERREAPEVFFEPRASEPDRFEEPPVESAPTQARSAYPRPEPADSPPAEAEEFGDEPAGREDESASGTETAGVARADGGFTRRKRRHGRGLRRR